MKNLLTTLLCRAYEFVVDVKILLQTVISVIKRDHIFVQQKMSKLLIIGASVLQLPAIKKAKELGHVVAVADYNPSAIGIPYADRYYNASTIDVEAICDVAKDFRQMGL